MLNSLWWWYKKWIIFAKICYKSRQYIEEAANTTEQPITYLWPSVWENESYFIYFESETQRNSNCISYLCAIMSKSNEMMKEKVSDAKYQLWSMHCKRRTWEINDLCYRHAHFVHVHTYIYFQKVTKIVQLNISKSNSWNNGRIHTYIYMQREMVRFQRKKEPISLYL